MNILKLREKMYYLLIGFCPFLALSSGLINAFFGAVVFILVTLLTLITMKTLERYIETNFYEGFVIFVSLFYLTLFKVIFIIIGFDFISNVGVYYPLIGVNAYILFLYEIESGKKVDSITNNVKTFSIYLVFLVIFSTFREILGTGKLNLVIRVGETDIGSIIDFSFISDFLSTKGDEFFGLPFFILPSAGFIILGLVIALYQFIVVTKSEIDEDEGN